MEVAERARGSPKRMILLLPYSYRKKKIMDEDFETCTATVTTVEELDSFLETNRAEGWHIYRSHVAAAPNGEVGIAVTLKREKVLANT